MLKEINIGHTVSNVAFAAKLLKTHIANFIAFTAFFTAFAAEWPP